MHKYEEYVAYAITTDGLVQWLSRVAQAPQPYGALRRLGPATAKFASEAEARHAAEVFRKTDPKMQLSWRVQKCETSVHIPEALKSGSE